MSINSLPGRMKSRDPSTIITLIRVVGLLIWKGVKLLLYQFHQLFYSQYYYKCSG